MINVDDRLRKSGISTIGDIPWGTHICQFYWTKNDLFEILVPYFLAGLENDEFCLWITSEPLEVNEATASLNTGVKGLGDYISKHQIEILDYRDWYTRSGKFNAAEVLQSWVDKEREVLAEGFTGLRVSGNNSWLDKKDWEAFNEYETVMDSICGEHRMIGICTYSLEKYGASEVLDVMNNHEITLLRRNGLWRKVESDERKRLKKVLIASEVRFRRLFETAQDGIIILDADTGQITDSNPFIEEILNYSTEELKDKKIWEIGLFKDTLKSEDAFQKLLTEGYIRYEDLQLETKDGKPISVEFISNIYDNGENRIIQCNIREINERKEREAASEKYKELLEVLVKRRTNELEESNKLLLQEINTHKQMMMAITESENKYSKIFHVNTSPMAIISLYDEKINDVNEAFIKLSGYQRNECINSTPGDLQLYPLITDQGGVSLMHVEQSKIQELETEMRLKSGDIKSVLLSTESITIDANPFVIMLARDITERKLVQEQLIVTDRLASIGELSAGIAHEINNPLTGVIGFSDLLAERNDLPDDVREDLRLVNQEARRTAEIVRNLLIFARKHEAKKSSSDINTIIQSVLDLRSYEQKANNIKVETSLASDLPETNADAFRLQQVFLNIVINAEFFMNKAHGEGVLAITTERIGDMIKICFIDDGEGISPEYINHVFDPFFTTKGIGTGTGLGLSICHGIIGEHGGRIYAESEQGKGATFIVEVPIHVIDDSA